MLKLVENRTLRLNFSLNIKVLFSFLMVNVHFWANELIINVE